jgi:hypothetical protein
MNKLKVYDTEVPSSLWFEIPDELQESALIYLKSIIKETDSSSLRKSLLSRITKKELKSDYSRSIPVKCGYYIAIFYAREGHWRVGADNNSKNDLFKNIILEELRKCQNDSN